MSHVPMELVVDILRRLPAKPLLRFRSVSKPWCALIDSPDFIKSHCNRSLENNPNRNIILGDGHLYNIDFDSLYTAVKLDRPVRSELTGTGMEILGSMHGLLCLHGLKYDIVLWNPSTRKHLKLPASEIEFPNTFCPSIEYLFYGFGYDYLNDDYKVVRLIQFHRDYRHSFFSEVKVYSMKSNSWRRIQDFPYYILSKQRYGTLANGALHWVVSRKPKSDVANSIAAFDLRSEEYRLVPQPVFADNDFDMNVGVLGDCLTVNCNYYQVAVYFDLWVMKEYGVKESWTKLLSIAQPYVVRSFEFWKPIAFSKSGVQLLLKTSGVIHSFYWYDLEKKSLRSLNISGDISGALDYFDPYICVESLVQLNGGGVSSKRCEEATSTRVKEEN